MSLTIGFPNFVISSIPHRENGSHPVSEGETRSKRAEIYIYKHGARRDVAS